MNILITGGTGYIGSYILKKLCEENHSISLIIRNNSNLNRINNLKNKINFINSTEILSNISILRKYNFNVIIHLATSYGRNNESTDDMFTINLYLPVLLLEFAKENGVNYFINFDTALPKKINLYTLLKKQFIDWAKFFSRFETLTFINLKLEYVYGPNDSHSKFATWVTYCLINNVKDIELTEGKQLRDFIYINDLVDAFIIIFKQLNSINNCFVQYDISTGVQISIREFVKKIHLYSESATKLKFGTLPYRTHEKMNLRLNPSLLFNLGWRPKYNVDTGVLNLIKSIKEKHG